MEIDQSQYESATRAQQLLNTLLQDPKHGLTVKRMVKDKYPEAVIPDLNIIEQVTAPYDAKLAEMAAQNAALQKMIEDDRQSRAEEAAKVSLTSSLDSVRAKYGFTDEGMQKVVETMRDQNLAHAPEAAAALVQSQMPKPQTNARSPLLAPKIDVFGMQDSKPNDQWEKLHSRPWDYLADTCVDIINEGATA